MMIHLKLLQYRNVVIGSCYVASCDVASCKVV
jgi:hypothetical protein